MAKKTVAFRTIGCKQNQYDTDFLKEAFLKRGYELREEGPADLVVINTCAVTAKSAAKCRQAIRSAARTGAKVLVTGCYPQVAADEVKDLPGVIVVSGVRGRSGLVDLAEEALSTGKTIVDVKPHEKGEEFEETPVEKPSLTRAFLKIQEGCGDFCTYCIVPYARGPSRSRSLESILEEAKNLVEKGYREIVLTGTHLGLYGKDSGQKLRLSDVVKRLSEVEGLVRLRLSSLEPHDVADDLIDCLRLPQVCHHLHLPLQSGSDRILRMMGRRYDVRGFLSTVEKCRTVAPDLGLTTDIIVGFPGETVEDFRDTLKVVREVSFSRLHVFKFSARPGTPAYRFPGKVREQDKEERSRELISLGRELSLEFHRKHIGRTLEVLVEDSRTEGGLLQGLTRNYVRCWFSGPDELKGNLVSVVGRKATKEGLACDRI